MSKLDSAGNFVWAAGMGGSEEDETHGIAVDDAGNVYTTGIFSGQADFDPGVGTHLLTSTVEFEVFVSKLTQVEPPPASPTLSISDVTVTEGNSGTTLMIFTVSLSATYDAPVTVNYATADGTATTNNNDYVAKSDTLIFAPGETSKTITISVTGDTKKESDESFFVNLPNANGGLIDDGQGLGTILNDDGGGKGNGKGKNQLAFALAVDAAFEDWMTGRPKKR